MIRAISGRGGWNEIVWYWAGGSLVAGRAFHRLQINKRLCERLQPVLAAAALPRLSTSAPRDASRSRTQLSLINQSTDRWYRLIYRLVAPLCVHNKFLTIATNLSDNHSTFAENQTIFVSSLFFTFFFYLVQNTETNLLQVVLRDKSEFYFLFLCF